MVAVKLREAMAAYTRKTGQEMTYERLAHLTGLSRSTLESIASRRDYNTTLRTVGLICDALDCSVEDLLGDRPLESHEAAPPDAD